MSFDGLRVFALLASALLLASCKSKEPETKIVEGSAFLVNQQRQNIKLGGAKIYILKSEDVALHIEDAQTWVSQEISRRTDSVKKTWEYLQEKKRIAEDLATKNNPADSGRGDNLSESFFASIKEANQAKAEYEKAKFHLGRLNKEFIEHLFSKLPAPVAGAITDAEGRFKVEIPKVGKFAIACVEALNVEYENPSEIFGKYKPEGFFWYFYLPTEGSDGVIKVQLSNETLMGEGNQYDVVKPPLVNYEAKEPNF